MLNSGILLNVSPLTGKIAQCKEPHVPFYVIGGLLMLILAAGYFFQQPWAIRTWLWPDSPACSYAFIAAMQAAIAAAMLWIGFSGELSVIEAGRST